MEWKNYITIYKAKEINPNSNTYNFSVKNDWFYKYFSIIVTEFKIKFKRINLDYTGKNIHKSSYQNYGWSTFSYCSELLKVGSFYFDKNESNEDAIIVYFEDQKIK
jgi:hypothetical protein